MIFCISFSGKIKVEWKFARLLYLIAYNQIIYTRARARDQGDPPTPDSDDTADDAGDGRANVYTRMYTLIGLSMHSCALHHRGREVHLAGLQSRPDGLE